MHFVCTTLRMRNIAAHRFNCLSFSLRLTRTLVFNCLQLSSIRWLLLHLLRSAAATATVRAKNIWPVKASKLFICISNNRQKRALTQFDTLSTNLSISGGRFLKLVIMRKSNTHSNAHTHTQSHTRTHIEKVNNVCQQLTRFFYFVVSELSICKCIYCCVCQCICICRSLISLFALN